jgi:hypothetical protein
MFSKFTGLKKYFDKPNYQKNPQHRYINYKYTGKYRNVKTWYGKKYREYQYKGDKYLYYQKFVALYQKQIDPKTGRATDVKIRPLPDEYVKGKLLKRNAIFWSQKKPK